MAPHFDNREGYIWFNGRFCRLGYKTARSKSCITLCVSSVFEGERVYKKKIFKPNEHTERLFYSANTMIWKYLILWMK